MKRSFLFAAVISCFVIMSCNQGDTAIRPDGADTTKNGVRIFGADSSFLVGWRNYPNKALGFKTTLDMPIDAALAEACINEYKNRFGSTRQTEGVGFTQFVRFDTEKFRDWTTIHTVFERSTMIIVELGIYTRDVYERLRSDIDVKNDIPESHIGKITVFISPYLKEGIRATKADGALINPFNLGSLHP